MSIEEPFVQILKHNIEIMFDETIHDLNIYPRKDKLYIHKTIGDLVKRFKENPINLERYDINYDNLIDTVATDTVKKYFENFN